MRYNLYRNWVVDAKDDDIQWITVKGNHIPIKKGQSKEEAVKEFFESKGKSSGEKSDNGGKEKTQLQTTKGRKERKSNYNQFVKEVKSSISDPDLKDTVLKDIEERMFDFEEMNEDLFEEVLVKNDVPEKEIDKIMGTFQKKLDNGESGGKVYKNTMKKVREFKAKSDGTYDFNTGKPKDYPDGYSVSFHQNEPDEDGKWKSDYGRYTEEDYDKNVADLVKESGGELNIGYFSGTPEVSVWVKGIREAKKLMKKHNQKSIWDWKAMDEIPNPKYDPKKNPMKE